MKWVRFDKAGKPTYGIIEGDQVVEVQGTPFGRYRRSANRHSLKSSKLLAPVFPPTFYAQGTNYRSHVAWAAQYFHRPAGQIPSKSDVGYRAQSAICAAGDTIIIPKDAGKEFHYENELVVVIGKQAKHLTHENALSCVLGYTIGNDLSEREWQHMDRTLWRSKYSDTWKPMGPWIDTDFDVSKAWSVTRINGQEVSRYKTGGFVFDIPHTLVEITKYITLQPADVVWMGTDGATIPPLKDGDVVECEITGLGVLRNPVKREK